MKKYRIQYPVTRMEVYEIEAENFDDAESRAFGEGELVVDAGEMVNVEPGSEYDDA